MFREIMNIKSNRHIFCVTSQFQKPILLLVYATTTAIK